jgi:hypothetical protein
MLQETPHPVSSTALNASPCRQRPKRRSFWQRVLDQARSTGDWYLIPKLYTKNTAAQIASDIRRAHEHGPRDHRVRGLQVGEMWETKWSPTSKGAPGDCEVWVRLATS